MNDPATEAAKRGVGQHHWWLTKMDDDLMVSVVEYATDSAREALRPIRELHRPFDRPISWANTQTERVCNHCLGPVAWPCATAYLVYSEEEL